MDQILVLLDKYLIALYKVTGNPLLDYFFGTFLLSILVAVAGEVLFATAFAFNEKYLRKSDRTLSETHTLSMQALDAGDMEAYKACNKLANEAFGKVFFQTVALSSAKLCPVFFALAWMQSRFIDIAVPLPVTLPLIGNSVGYIFVFVVFYILTRTITNIGKRKFADKYY